MGVETGLGFRGELKNHFIQSTSIFRMILYIMAPVCQGLNHQDVLFNDDGCS